MKNRASFTAELMALFRALESLRPVGSRLFADPYAAMFLHGWRKWVYRMARFPGGLRPADALVDRYIPGARAAGIARTKWIDDQTTAALQTASQLVLLGAGFDTRAHRLAAAARATIFELDHPETSSVKQAALRNVNRTEPVRYVGIDFNRERIGEALARSRFNAEEPTCFIWEGVTNYLTAAAIDGVLREIRQSAQNSTLLFSYVDRAILETPEQFFGGVKLMARLQSYGEPWTFGLHPEEVKLYLAARGFEVLKDSRLAEVWRRAGRSSSATRGYEFYRVASARPSSLLVPRMESVEN